MLKCNQLIGFGAGGGFFANAVDYDGTNDWLSRSTALTGSTTTGVGLISVHIRRDSIAGNQQHVFDITGSNQRLFFGFTQTSTDDTFFFHAENTLSNVYRVKGSTEITDDGEYHHILIQWDHNQSTGSRVLRMYVDGVLQTNTIVTNTGSAFTINWATMDTMYVSRSIVGTTNNLNGAMSELYIAPAQTLDITNSANREKFTSGGRPAFLGENGSLPTGTAPLIYLPNKAATVNVNAGTGGNFVISGSPVDASTSPSD